MIKPKAPIPKNSTLQVKVQHSKFILNKITSTNYAMAPFRLLHYYIGYMKLMDYSF